MSSDGSRNDGPQGGNPQGSNRGPRDGGRKKSRRRKPGGGGGGGGRGDRHHPDMLPDLEEVEVISQEDLERTRNAMNLTELKRRPAHELVALAESMGAGEPGPLAQAGHHLLDPQGAREERRGHLRRRRAGDPAGRLRLPAFRRRLLSRRAGRHLRQPEPDPPLQPAHRRHRLRPDPAAEGRRALLRAAEGRRDQLRRAGERASQGAVREPDAAVPQRAPAHGAGQRQHAKI